MLRGLYTWYNMIELQNRWTDPEHITHLGHMWIYLYIISSVHDIVFRWSPMSSYRGPDNLRTPHYSDVWSIFPFLHSSLWFANRKWPCEMMAHSWKCLVVHTFLNLQMNKRLLHSTAFSELVTLQGLFCLIDISMTTKSFGCKPKPFTLQVRVTYYSGKSVGINSKCVSKSGTWHHSEILVASWTHPSLQWPMSSFHRLSWMHIPKIQECIWYIHWIWFLNICQ